jgi:hypothetical protein
VVKFDTGQRFLQKKEYYFSNKKIRIDKNEKYGKVPAWEVF